MEELAPLAIATPFAAAALLAASLPLNRRRDDLIAVIAASAVVILCGALLVDALGSEGPLTSYLGGWRPSTEGVELGIVMAIDPLGAALATLAAGLVTVALLFTWRYFETQGPIFHALLLVFLGGLTGFALTGDLFNLFVFFEVMSVSAYALTAYQIERPAPLQGALSFAVVNSIGAMMILFGIALVYGRTGALNMAQVGEALAGEPADGLVVVAFALMVGGFLVKAAAVPFHFWLADAYAVAPTPAAIVFTGVMSDLGIYAVARLYWTVFEGPLGAHADGIRVVLVTFAVLTALLGAVMCLFQNHLKRLLAFATISQVGLALIGVALLTPGGIAAAALLIPADGLLRAGLFVCLGILLHRCSSIHELRLQGRGREVPRLIGVLFVAGAVGLAALPPLGAFAGKGLLEEAGAEVGYGWVAVVALVATALTSGALLRAAARIFLGRGIKPEAQEGEIEESEVPAARGYTPAVMMMSATVLIVAGLVLGAIPGLVGNVQEAAAQFTDRALYAGAVLDRPVPVPAVEGHLHIGALEVLLSLLSGVSSFAVGAALLRIRRPYSYPKGRLNPLGAALLRLRRLHSGQIGDYVAWGVLGFAALGGSLALAVSP
jgi:multicomponent Na+:H+ antiporter subunit D